MGMVMYGEAEEKRVGQNSKDIAYGDRGEWIEIAAKVSVQIL